MAHYRRGYIRKDVALLKLKTGRDAAIQVCREAKIKSDEYRAAIATVEAIDLLAETLTSDDHYFHEKGSGDHTGENR